ncbi:MAG: hypothetical protein V1712_02725 [Patescibacteria group bacterium]
MRRDLFPFIVFELPDDESMRNRLLVKYGIKEAGVAAIVDIGSIKKGGSNFWIIEASLNLLSSVHWYYSNTGRWVMTHNFDKLVQVIIWQFGDRMTGKICLGHRQY